MYCAQIITCTHTYTKYTKYMFVYWQGCTHISSYAHLGWSLLIIYCTVIVICQLLLQRWVENNATVVALNLISLKLSIITTCCGLPLAPTSILMVCFLGFRMLKVVNEVDIDLIMEERVLVRRQF